MAISFATSDASIKRGDLARRAGCHLETVRYYEKIGLLAEPSRSEGGHRRYDLVDQRRLRFILRGQELGFSIDEVRSLLSLVDTNAYTCGEIRDLAVDHLAAVRKKINDLSRLERTLAKISSGCTGGAVPECPVIDALWAD